ncbi:MAG: LpxD N-terminal domain-containing protein, partial [Opitutales bacterium]
MRFSYPVGRLLKLAGADATCRGAYDGEITGIASLAEAGSGDISFLSNPKYRQEAESSKASVLLVSKDAHIPCRKGQLQIEVANPSFVLALLCRDIEAQLEKGRSPGIHPTAVVAPDAEISPEASIGPMCVIGEAAKIGAAVLEN